MKVKVSGLTDVGLKRDNNQDAFFVDEELNLLILADGMGGHQGGEVASALAVDAIKAVITEGMKDKNLNPYDLMQAAYTEASRAIYAHALHNPRLKGMGTTTVTAFIHKNNIYVGNVGDSRCYLLHPPYIWQMTDDHSLLNEQIRAGLVKPEQIPQFAARNVITRSVGFEETVIADVIQREISEGDSILLCSDGLSGLVSDKRICDVCLTMPFKDIVPRLIEDAKRNGGDDNVTIIYAQPILHS
jgi:serine/threonine protein phosphatase PrpC